MTKKTFCDSCGDEITPSVEYTECGRFFNLPDNLVQRVDKLTGVNNIRTPKRTYAISIDPSVQVDGNPPSKDLCNRCVNEMLIEVAKQLWTSSDRRS